MTNNALSLFLQVEVESILYFYDLFAILERCQPWSRVR